ncbi:MAG: cation:proton antiporter [archaeon]|nr:cation:proton antiporter [archaeon]
MALNIEFLILLVTIIMFIGLGGDLLMKRFPIPTPLFLVFFGYLLGTITLPIGMSFLFPGTSGSLLPLPTAPFLSIAPLFSTIALIIILFYGGLEIRSSDFLRNIPRVLIEVNIYVLLGILSIAGLATFLFHWDIWTALLMGSIVGGETSAAVVVPLTKLVKMSEATKTFLILESTLNSIYCVVFYFTFLRVIQGQGTGPAEVLSGIGVSILSGVVAGVALGYLWRFISPALSDFDFSYVVAILLVLSAYLISNYFGGGLVSSLAFGLVAFRRSSLPSSPASLEIDGLTYRNEASPNSSSSLANSKDGAKSYEVTYLSRTHYEITFVMKTFFFVLLGLLLTAIPSNVVYSALSYGALFTLALFALRFLASRISTFKSSFKPERNLILFTMAQGLTPAVLAVSTVSFGVPDASMILSLALAVILYTNILTMGSPIFARLGRKAVRLSS